MFAGGDQFDGFDDFNGINRRGRTFAAKYRCYSVTMFTERKEVEEGGKVIMPPSALDQLTQLNTQYPMLFKLTNPAQNMTSHCGVLEFIADEGKIYIPYWMMQNLCLAEGTLIDVESATMPLGTFALFQPQSKEFLDIYNPKAVLEASLRKLSCLSLRDMLKITYNQKFYEFRVLELKPANAVSIIECDLSVDFAPYVGAEEDERQRLAQRPDPVNLAQEQLRVAEEKRIEKAVQEANERNGGFKAFRGSGNTLDTGGRGAKKGRKKGKQSSSPASSVVSVAAVNGANEEDGYSAATGLPRARGVPNYSYEKGTLTFARVFPKKEEAAEEEEFSAFGGSGHCLRKKRR